MYLEKEIITRVNITFLRIDEKFLMVFQLGNVENDPLLMSPTEILSVLQIASLESYTSKIANYSFVCTVIVVWSFSVLMAQIRVI